MHRSPALQRPVVLGSTSRYRRELLQRLNLRFQVAAPAVDETPQPGEAPRALALRLALAKARAAAQQHPEALVIGADQVAALAGAPLGKPGQHQRAVQQLRQMRGQAVAFQTAVAVVCAATGFEQWDLACVQVQFRALSDAEIERYLRAEQPYDCAGSAKSEGLGIALLDAIHSDDPTALMGLPLIRTCRMLRAAGLTLPEVRPTPPRTQARVACIWCPLRWTLAATARSRCRTSCRPAPCRRRPGSGTGGAGGGGGVYLVPAPLDFGCDSQVPLPDILPASTLQTAARLRHWVCENAKSTRAYLKRIDALHGLATPLQQQQITELPRAVQKKGDHDAQGAARLDAPALLAAALAGQDMGLVSEAG